MRRVWSRTSKLRGCVRRTPPARIGRDGLLRGSIHRVPLIESIVPFTGHGASRSSSPTNRHLYDIHPLHLHRHSFELRRIGGVPTAGVIKDVVMLGGFHEIELDFVADNPGRTLFHCHQQLHMDFGFMELFDYV